MVVIHLIHPTRKNIGSDIKIRIKLTLLEVLNGVKKNIKLKRNHVCKKCSGKGGTETETCAVCKGNGKQIHIQNTILGQMQSVTECNHCNGFGYSIKTPCSDCNSSGYISEEEIFEIDLPPGLETGMQLNQSGAGHYVKNGLPGKLIALIEVEEDNNYIRNGNNLHTMLDISIPDAILGCERTIKNIEGKDLEIKIKPGTPSGTSIKFRDEGLPDFNYKIRGDMICKINVYVPKTITEKEKEIISKLNDSDNFKR